MTARCVLMLIVYSVWSIKQHTAYFQHGLAIIYDMMAKYQ